MPLSDVKIRGASARDKPYKIFDGGGLHLVVTPKEARLWRLKYRFAGREKLLSFGPYPLVSLKLARAKRDAARLQLIEGQDPGEVKRAARVSDQRNRAFTFDHLAAEYLEKLEREGRAAATMRKTRWLLEIVKPQLGSRPIAQIEAPDILELLRQIESKGTYETSRRLRSTIGTIFRFAIATGRASSDPTAALKGALVRPQVRSRSALLDPKEIGRLLLTIETSSGQPTTKHALCLLALLAPRPGELRLAKWEEFDLEAAVWRVPAERMKMRRPHRVPLPARALQELAELARFTGDSEFLFPSIKSWKKPISENTLNVALKRMGYGADQVTAHGFRATFSTLANESGLWHSDAIERALAHIENNDVRRAYVRGEHWEERVRMAHWWANQLDGFRTLARA